MRIRTLVLSLPLALGLIWGPLPAAGGSGDEVPALGDLSWRTGTWVQEGGNQHLVETWAPPVGDAISGCTAVAAGSHNTYAGG